MICGAIPPACLTNNHTCCGVFLLVSARLPSLVLYAGVWVGGFYLTTTINIIK